MTTSETQPLVEVKKAVGYLSEKAGSRDSVPLVGSPGVGAPFSTPPVGHAGSRVSVPVVMSHVVSTTRVAPQSCGSNPARRGDIRRARGYKRHLINRTRHLNRWRRAAAAPVSPSLCTVAAQRAIRSAWEGNGVYLQVLDESVQPSAQNAA